MPTSLWINYIGLICSAVGFMASMMLHWKWMAFFNFVMATGNYLIILVECKSDRS